MKNKYALLAGGAALLAALQRSLDVLLHIEPDSGFYSGGSTELRLGVLVAAAALCVWFSRRHAQAPPAAGRRMPAAGALFAAAGFFAAFLSVLQFFNEVFFAPSRAVGVVSALCALFGLCAAWWFFAAAGGCFTGGDIAAGLLPAGAVVWYCLRALNIFVREPVNARDSVTISLLLCAMALAAACLALARRQTGFPAVAAAAFIACAGFALPCAVCLLLSEQPLGAARLVGDAMVAGALYLVAVRCAGDKKEVCV